MDAIWFFCNLDFQIIDWIFHFPSRMDNTAINNLGNSYSVKASAGPFFVSKICKARSPEDVTGEFLLFLPAFEWLRQGSTARKWPVRLRKQSVCRRAVILRGDLPRRALGEECFLKRFGSRKINLRSKQRPITFASVKLFSFQVKTLDRCTKYVVFTFGM